MRALLLVLFLVRVAVEVAPRELAVEEFSVDVDITRFDVGHRVPAGALTVGETLAITRAVLPKFDARFPSKPSFTIVWVMRRGDPT